MSVYALTSLARADIFDIWSYIAEDSEAAADLRARLASNLILKAGRDERAEQRSGSTAYLA